MLYNPNFTGWPMMQPSFGMGFNQFGWGQPQQMMNWGMPQIQSMVGQVPQPQTMVTPTPGGRRRKRGQNTTAMQEPGVYNPQAGAQPDIGMAPSSMSTNYVNQVQGGPAQNPGSGFGPAGTWNGAYEAGNVSTPFGQLVASSTGNQNVFKKNGSSENDGLYSYDPNSGWQQMSMAQYQANPNAQYANPYDHAAQSGASRAKYQMQGGMLKPLAGYGTYA